MSILTFKIFEFGDKSIFKLLVNCFWKYFLNSNLNKWYDNIIENNVNNAPINVGFKYWFGNFWYISNDFILSTIFFFFYIF